MNNTRAPVGDNDSVKIKRPFLRKNQGRAAWCSRLSSPSKKIIANVDGSKKSSLTSNENQKKSLGNSKPLHDEIKWRKAEGVSQPSVNIHSCDSTTDSYKPAKSLPNSTAPNENEKFAVFNNTLNTTGDEGELAEFEMLERLAENHSNILDVPRSICDSSEKSQAVDVLPNNFKQMNNNGGITDK